MCHSHPAGEDKEQERLLWRMMTMIMTMMVTMMMTTANLLIIMILKTMMAKFRIFITTEAVTRSKELHLQLVWMNKFASLSISTEPPPPCWAVAKSKFIQTAAAAAKGGLHRYIHTTRQKQDEWHLPRTISHHPNVIQISFKQQQKMLSLWENAW